MEKTVAIPQLLLNVQDPQVHVVAETAEIPQLPLVEKNRRDPGNPDGPGPPQTSESLNGEISTFQLKLRMDTMWADEQEEFTKVNDDTEQVARETCVKDNTDMVAREVAVAEKANHETVVRGVVQNIGLDSFIDAEACMQQPHRSQEQQTVGEKG